MSVESVVIFSTVLDDGCTVQRFVNAVSVLLSGGCNEHS